MHHPTDRITHATAFVTPVMEHWLEREIAQWVLPMKDRSDDPSHHERTLYLWATSHSLVRTEHRQALPCFKSSLENITAYLCVRIVLQWNSRAVRVYDGRDLHSSHVTSRRIADTCRNSTHHQAKSVIAPGRAKTSSHEHQQTWRGKRYCLLSFHAGFL